MVRNVLLIDEKKCLYLFCITKTTEYMKKYLKAIGCFPIFVLAVFLYFREQSYKLDSLSLQNVEALAEGEEYTHISCIGVGSLDCPVNHSGVKYIFKGY